MMSVLISLLATLRGFVRSRAPLHAEVLALRHQLLVLQRSRPRRLRGSDPGDASKVLPRIDSLVLVKGA